MQVRVDVKFMYARFGGCGFFDFGDMATFQKRPNFPFLTMDYSPWSWRKLIDRNRLKKFMQVRVDVKFMYARFGGCGFFGFGDMVTFEKRPNFPF